MTKYFITLALIISTFQVNAAVWNETSQWNEDWEIKFSNWVDSEFNEDIFTAGKYSGIPTDCADAVYFSRLIFAAENKLPFVIKDPTGGSTQITNKMSRFDSSKDPQQRLRKFMLYIAGLVSTKSLPHDTYPTKINRENIRPGAVWSRPRIKRENIINIIFGSDVKEDPGHAEIVKSVSEVGAIEVIGSTVPAAIRKLQTTSSLVFMPIETTTGLRRWYLPQEYSIKVNELKNYSLEQFQMGVSSEDNSRTLSTWTYDVKNRLKIRNETKEENLNRIIKDLCTLSRSRVDTIKKGAQERSRNRNQCMSASAHDSYSTPSRDKRIFETLKRATLVGGGFGFTTRQQMKKLEPQLRICEIKIREGQKITLWDFLNKMADDKVSSDPNDNFESRWGLAESDNKDCSYN